MALDTRGAIRGSLSRIETTDSESPAKPMDQELISYLEAQFRENSQRIESFREETKSKFEQMGGEIKQMGGEIKQMETRLKRVEQGVRHNGVQIEALRGEVQLIAEAYIGLQEKLECSRIDMAGELEQVRISIRTPFETLGRRLRLLEEQPERDAMALIRKKYGKGIV